MSSSKRKIPVKKVAERFGVTVRTIDRWIVDEDLGFPDPIYINKRRYVDEEQLECWERARASRSQPQPPKPAARAPKQPNASDAA